MLAFMKIFGVLAVIVGALLYCLFCGKFLCCGSWV